MIVFVLTYFVFCAFLLEIYIFLSMFIYRRLTIIDSFSPLTGIAGEDLSDCESCTATVKSDGESACSWYSGLDGGNGYCGVGGCDMNGNCPMES